MIRIYSHLGAAFSVANPLATHLNSLLQQVLFTLPEGLSSDPPLTPFQPTSTQKPIDVYEFMFYNEIVIVLYTVTHSNCRRKIVRH